MLSTMNILTKIECNFSFIASINLTSIKIIKAFIQLCNIKQSFNCL